MTLKDTKTPKPPKCRGCREVIGSPGYRSEPASVKKTVRRGGREWHPECVPEPRRQRWDDVHGWVPA